MTQVTVRASLPLTWLALGETATVERSLLVDGAIRNGALELVAIVPEVPARLPEPPAKRAEDPPPASPAKRSRKR